MRRRRRVSQGVSSKAVGLLAGVGALFMALAPGCAREAERRPETSHAKLLDLSGAAPEWLGEKMLGGATTAINEAGSSHAFSFPAANLSEASLERHTEGDPQFEKQFVQGSGGAQPDHGGLGPVFNNSSCIGCHTRDGRGSLPVMPAGATSVVLDDNASLLLRLSIEPAQLESLERTLANSFGAPVPVPGYGRQLFQRSVSRKLRPESMRLSGHGDVRMTYRTRQIIFPDGEIAELRQPVFTIENAYDPRLAASDVKLSPRMASPMIGLGLLEAIKAEDILALADLQDKNRDGIRGRPNYVFDAVKARAGEKLPVSLGRFGWKASHPTLLQQSLAALNGDIGVTNFLFPDENICGTPLLEAAARAGLLPTELVKCAGPGDPVRPTDASEETARAIVDYAQTLAVPARRGLEDELSMRGGRVFAAINCTGCHAPTFTTGAHADFPELSGQKIHPFTDLLLHDMGEELADHRRDFEAGGRDWRTPPLWGIGLTHAINPRAGFLHDGRARTVQEAILYHGGEAARSRDAFLNLHRDDRRALIRFLQNL